MSHEAIDQFIRGALTMSCLVASLFFLRFWRMSRDRLFVYFALAFAVLAANWLVLGLMDVRVEEQHYVFALRLVAFGLIIAGVIDKNRRNRRT